MPGRRPLIPLAAALALALSGCGETGVDDPIDVTREFIEGYDRGDVSRVCEDLVNERYLRSIAGGGDGGTACRRQVEELAKSNIRLDVVPRVRERGDIVDVTARIIVDGVPREQRIRMRRDGDGLRIERVEEREG